MIIKKHSLYGDIKFNVDLQQEDDCNLCIHNKVCIRNWQYFCLNYEFGTSQRREAHHGCIHRFTKFTLKEENQIPCFKCRHFKLEVDKK